MIYATLACIAYSFPIPSEAPVTTIKVKYLQYVTSISNQPSLPAHPYVDD